MKIQQVLFVEREQQRSLLHKANNHILTPPGRSTVEQVIASTGCQYNCRVKWNLHFATNCIEEHTFPPPDNKSWYDHNSQPFSRHIATSILVDHLFSRLPHDGKAFVTKKIWKSDPQSTEDEIILCPPECFKYNVQSTHAYWRRLPLHYRELIHHPVPLSSHKITNSHANYMTAY